MESSSRILPIKKTVALVAHDNLKQELIDWAKSNVNHLRQHHLQATGTSGNLLEQALALPIKKYLSGPLGGDQQIGAAIAECKVDVLIFFWDPFEPMPHDPDVKALLRIAAVWNIPVACNRATADMLIHSPLFNSDYQTKIPHSANYQASRLKQ